MNTVPMIDVIVPVYNVYEFLEKCVNSLLHQDFKDYIITLSDDGSYDGSEILCDEYARAYPDKIRVLHSENGGLSAARNRAVEQSASEYIAFVDSDDHVTADYLSSMYNAIINYGTDMAVGTVTREFVLANGTVRLEPPEHMMEACRLDRDAALRELLYETYFSGYACAKLIPRRIILAHPFPVGKIFEDSAVQYKFFLDCSSVAYIPKPCYFYLQRSNSLQHSPFTDRHKTLPFICRDILYYLRDRNVSSDVLQAAAYKVWRGFYITLFHAAMLPLHQYMDVWREIKPICNEIADDVRHLPRMTIKQRILMTLSLHFPRMFRFTAKIKDSI